MLSAFSNELLKYFGFLSGLLILNNKLFLYKDSFH